MGPRAKKTTEPRLVFSLFAEGEDTLILRDARGTEKRRLVMSPATLARFTLDEVAEDLESTLAYDMKDQQGAEDTRR